MQGHKVLFLGRDNFVVYELRGSRPFTAVRNYYDPNYVKPNLRLKDVFQKFDFDSVTPATLAPLPVRDHDPRRLRQRPAGRPSAAAQDLGLRALEAGRTGGRAAHARRGRPTRCAARLLGARAGRPSGRRGTATVFAAPPVIGGALVAELHGRERLGLLAGAEPARRAMGDLDSVRRDPPAARHRPGARRDAARQPRLPGLRPVLRRGRARRRPRRPGPVHGQRRAPATGGPPAGHEVGGPPRRDRGQPGRARAGRSPARRERRVPLSRACGRYVDWYRRPAAALNRI